MITIDEARDLYKGADSAHDFDHVLRVLALAERIARAEGADLAVVRTAVLLHDMARHEESCTGRDHAEVGAERARELLASRGAAPAFVEAVATAIASHRFRIGKMPSSLEAKIVYDADKLDAIGAIGVARAYAVGGRSGQRLWGVVDETTLLSSSNLTTPHPEHTPVHEYAIKLVKLKDLLYTAEARRIARGRHRFMVAFFARLEREVRGEA